LLVAVTSSVPQGTVLGPILFLVCINDPPDYIKHSQIRLFADDSIIYRPIKTQAECIKPQEDVFCLQEKMLSRLLFGQIYHDILAWRWVFCVALSQTLLRCPLLLNQFECCYHCFVLSITKNQWKQGKFHLIGTIQM
jgi:hypothetical protein